MQRAEAKAHAFGEKLLGKAKWKKTVADAKAAQANGTLADFFKKLLETLGPLMGPLIQMLLKLLLGV